MISLKYKSDDGRGVTLALTVPATAKRGQAVALGTAGFFGILETDRVTDDILKAGNAPQGLKTGQASVNLPGVGQVLYFATIPGTIPDFGKVYTSGDGAGTLTDTAAAGAVQLGWKLPNGYVAIRYNT